MNQQFQLERDGLGGRASRATGFSLIGRAVRIGSQALTFLVLARFVSPADFGLIAMVMPVLATIMVFGDLGLTASTAQAKEVSHGQASALFYLSVATGVGFSIVFAAFAPLLAALYGEDRVIFLVLTVSVVFFSAGLGAQHQALLQRTLRFRELLIAELLASFGATAAAIAVGAQGGGYWALALRVALHPLIYAIAVILLARWWPGRPDWGTKSRSMVKYGGWSLGANFLNVGARNIDNVLIGWRWGEVALGPYALAYRLFFLPVQQITHPIGSVMIPTLVRLNDEPESYKKAYLKILGIMSFVTIPPMLFVAVAAHDLIHIAVGPQWDAAGDILRWLAPVGALHVPYLSAQWLMLSQGRADRAFALSFASSTVCVCAFLIGLPHGAIGVAAAYAIANIVIIGPGVVWACRGNPVTPFDVVKCVAPVAAVACVSTVVASGIYFGLEATSPLVRVGVSGVAIAMVMAATAPWALGKAFVRDVLGRLRLPFAESARKAA